MLKHLKYLQKNAGDTLVEVLFAVTVFSLVVVGGIAIMNQGTSTAQRSLEVTLVRQEIDSQAEALRFLNASYVAAYQPSSSSAQYPEDSSAGQWLILQNSIDQVGLTSASAFDAGATCQTPPEGSFIINTRRATFVPPSDGKIVAAPTFSQVRYVTVNNEEVLTAAEGIWIEAVRVPTVVDNFQSTAGYIDFHIRACWDSPGQSVPMRIGTIVRLYEPRG